MPADQPLPATVEALLADGTTAIIRPLRSSTRTCAGCADRRTCTARGSPAVNGGGRGGRR